MNQSPFKDLKIILASNSPRRQEILAGIDVDFEVVVYPDIDESYPSDLPALDVAEFIARKKSEPYLPLVGERRVVLTADTVVIVDDDILGKPRTLDEARTMLRRLSGRSHIVVTGVTLASQRGQRSFSVRTDVRFRSLTDAEIDYYVDHYRPLDKAGAYGIQEWVGYIGIEGISGSYYNVMGLPIQRIVAELKAYM